MKKQFWLYDRNDPEFEQSVRLTAAEYNAAKNGVASLVVRVNKRGVPDEPLKPKCVRWWKNENHPCGIKETWAW